MSKLLREATTKMEAARPTSGCMPETEAEWVILQEAVEFFAYAMYVEYGVPKEEARRIAEILHAGRAGRLLLEYSFLNIGKDGGRTT